jgi:acetolactate synthase regulatory subunit
MTDTKLAHVKLNCTSSSVLLERILQTSRYRGFRILNLHFYDVKSDETEVNLLVKGQAKLTTLQKSLEAIVEVQQCYLNDDQAKLTTLLEKEPSGFITTNIRQPALG